MTLDTRILERMQELSKEDQDKLLLKLEKTLRGETVKRAEILERARVCVCGEREQDYGSPEKNFETIANLWTAYLQGAGVRIDFLEPHDVAAMLALLKIARISSGHAKEDNWVDLAGYAACGGELQETSVDELIKKAVDNEVFPAV